MSCTEIENALERYIKLTGEALKKVSILPEKDTEMFRVGKSLIDMAERYYNDAIYFKEKKMLKEAFTAVVYAHAWLDVGVRMGILKGGEPKLFMVEP